MKKSFFTAPLFLIAAAGVTFANQLPNITAPALPANIPTENPIELIGELSPQCQAALFSVVANPEFFQCVPVAALLPVLTDPSFLPSILSNPIGNFPKLIPIFDATCALPKCSAEGVANAQKAVEEGCKDDLKNPLIELALTVFEFYSPARDIICFKDNKDEYCSVDLIKTLTTLPAPPQKLLGPPIDNLLFAEPRFICTPCDKAIVNTLINFFKKHPEALKILDDAVHIGPNELFIANIYFSVKCGFEFLDGKVPDPTTDPSKFKYQVADNSSGASQKEMNMVMLVSLIASTFVLN